MMAIIFAVRVLTKVIRKKFQISWSWSISTRARIIGTGLGTISSETKPTDTTICMIRPIVNTNRVVTTIGRFNADCIVLWCLN